MAASSPRANRHKEDIHTRSLIHGNTLSKPTPRASPSSGRFKDVAKRVIATSTRGSSKSLQHDAPSSLHPSESRSSDSGKARRNSLSNVAVHAMNGVNRTASDCTAHKNSGTTGRKDNRHFLANPHTGLQSDLGSQRKLVSGNLASASSKLRDSRDAATTDQKSHARIVAETDQKSHARMSDSPTQHKITNELCKDCRSRISRMDSVCYITNDGRIAAAPTGALHARHSHHCNTRGCARNQIHCQPPSVPSSRRDSLSRRQASLINPQPTRRKSVLGLPRTGTDHGSTVLSVQGDDVERQEAESSLRGSAHEMTSTTGSVQGDDVERQEAGSSMRGSAHEMSSTPGSVQGDDVERQEAESSLRGSAHEMSSTPGSVQEDDVEREEAESTLRGIAHEMSSMTGSDTLDMKKEIDLKEAALIKRSSDDDAESCVNTNSSGHTLIDQNGCLDADSPRQERSSSSSQTPQVPIDQESYIEITRTENVEAWSSPAPSSILSDINGDDDDKGSPYGDDSQALNDFQGITSYHGDNEYSCSEGGTDATTTPVSSSKGAFDDLSNIDIEQSHSENGMLQSRRSAFARITRKYLETLKEQEAEKVRLRKQEIMARRQAGDWMMDGHMEEVLHRLAPNGEAHVKVLVEAFETVMNQSDSDCSQTAHSLDREHVRNLRHAEASS